MFVGGAGEQDEGRGLFRGELQASAGAEVESGGIGDHGGDGGIAGGLVDGPESVGIGGGVDEEAATQQTIGGRALAAEHGRLRMAPRPDPHHEAVVISDRLLGKMSEEVEGWQPVASFSSPRVVGPAAVPLMQTSSSQSRAEGSIHGEPAGPDASVGDGRAILDGADGIAEVIERRWCRGWRHGGVIRVGAVGSRGILCGMRVGPNRIRSSVSVRIAA